ncbi:DUF1996 domain-containing protein [Actinosynnema sp. NPDC020468]|uniref:DUF1996 domain-containing protein n=1 Tax=Actinosynnema sp. NPDC020468 TaxID=3154488 RepID=UPI0033DBB3CB
MRRLLPLLLVLSLTGCGAGNRYADPDDMPTRPPPASPGQDASTGDFTVPCGRNEERHLNADNIVSAPGQPFGAHHTHEYVGNRDTDAFSTDATLATAATTCAHDDRSTYYWPVLRLTDRTGADAHAQGGGVHGNTGEVLPPADVAITYTGNPQSHVVPPPRFLRMITGDPAAFTNGGGRARWSCEGREDRVTDRYPRCDDARTVREFEFPSCWDGRNTDSTSHRAHVVFPADNGVCRPGTFPIPKLKIRTSYAVPPGEEYAIDSFPEQFRDPGTDHAMVVEVMPDALTATLVDCLNAGRSCR